MPLALSGPLTYDLYILLTSTSGKMMTNPTLKMKLKTRTSFLLITTTSMLISGCDMFTIKTPLAGKREIIFANETGIKAETANNTAIVSIPKGEHNKSWSVPGGNLSNALPPLFLSEKPTKIWSTSIGYGSHSERRFTSNVIVDNDHIYTMDTRGVVSARRLKDGHQLWSVPTAPGGADADTLGGGISSHQGKIYIATSFGEIIALNSADGKEMWRQHLQNPFRIAPTMSDGKIFVVNIANETFALNEKTGDLLWNHSGLPESTGILGGAVPAIASGLLIVPYSSGEIYALNLHTGQPKWVETITPSLSSDSLSNISHIRARPIVYNDTVYAISYGGRIVALDLQTGERRWQREFSGIRTPAVFGDYLYFIGIDGDLVCLNRHSGQVTWSTHLKTVSNDKTKINWAGPVIAGGHLLLTGTNGIIAMHSLKDGKQIHTWDGHDSLFLSPIVVNGQLLTLSDSATLTLWR